MLFARLVPLALAAISVAVLPINRAQAGPFPKPKPSYGEAAVTLPLVLVPGDPKRLYVRVEDDNLGERLFFVDTAFSRTTCDDQFVQDLGLEVRRTASRSRGELGTVRLGSAELPPFEIGGHRIEGMKCAVRDLDSTSSVTSTADQPVAGVLGANLLARFVVVIDLDAGTITLHDPATHGVEDGPGVVRLRRERWVGPRIRLPLTVDGAVTWPLLDTGATRTHLDARRLDLLLLEEREGMARASGATNAELTVFRIHQATDVLLGEHQSGPLRVLDRRRAARVPGLAGQYILNQFVLTIDTRHRRLRVEARGTDVD